MRYALILAALLPASPAFAQVVIVAEPSRPHAAPPPAVPETAPQPQAAPATERPAEPKARPERFDPAKHTGLLLGADWCQHCPAAERQAASDDRIGYLDIDADTDEVAKYWTPRSAGMHYFDKEAGRLVRGRPVAVPAFVQLRDGVPVSAWVPLPKRADGKIDFGKMLGGPQGSATPPAAAQSDSPSAAVVKVLAGDARGSGEIVASEGGRYLAVTCSHVVRAGWPHAILAGGTTYPAEVLRHDAKADLALVAFTAPEGLAVLPVADEPPTNRTPVTTHGYPGGGSRRDRPSYAVVGHAVGLYEVPGGFLQGESGGAVIAGGKLVGVITGTDGRTGLAVDLPTVKAFLAQGAKP